MSRSFTNLWIFGNTSLITRAHCDTFTLNEEVIIFTGATGAESYQQQKISS